MGIMAVAVDPTTGCVLRTRYRMYQPPPTPQPLMAVGCNHPDIAGLVQAFVDGKLSPTDRTMVRDHLNLCSSCKEKARTSQSQQES